MNEHPCFCRIELIVGEVDGIEFLVEDNNSLDMEMGDSVIHVSDIPYYEGETEVIPMLNTVQTLETEGTQLRSDITVREIPIVETTNPYGGKTVLIG